MAVVFKRSFEDLCDLKDKVNVSLLLNFLLAKHHMQHQLKFDIENAHRNSLDPQESVTSVSLALQLKAPKHISL